MTGPGNADEIWSRMKFEGERRKKREKLAGYLTRPGFEVEGVGRGGWQGASRFGTAGGGRLADFQGAGWAALGSQGRCYGRRGQSRAPASFFARHGRPPPVPPLYFEHGCAAFEL